MTTKKSETHWLFTIGFIRFFRKRFYCKIEVICNFLMWINYAAYNNICFENEVAIRKFINDFDLFGSCLPLYFCSVMNINCLVTLRNSIKRIQSSETFVSFELKPLSVTVIGDSLITCCVSVLWKTRRWVFNSVPRQTWDSNKAVEGPHGVIFGRSIKLVIRPKTSFCRKVWVLIGRSWVEKSIFTLFAVPTFLEQSDIVRHNDASSLIFINRLLQFIPSIDVQGFSSDSTSAAQNAYCSKRSVNSTGLLFGRQSHSPMPRSMISFRWCIYLPKGMEHTHSVARLWRKSNQRCARARLIICFQSASRGMTRVRAIISCKLPYQDSRHERCVPVAATLPL